jgi:acetylserotonin N-methyltransferase
MFAAVSLGVFDALASGPRPLDDLLKSLTWESRSLNPDALERLLDACVGLRLIRYRDGRYENLPVASAYLWSSSPYRLTGYIHSSNDVFWQLWGNLESAIQEGTHRWEKTFGWKDQFFKNMFKTEEAKTEFIMGMHGWGQISSPRLVEAFSLNQFNNLVDLGGGTGHVAIAFCQKHTDSRKSAIVFDLPEVVPLAEKVIGEAGLSNRIKVQGGDFFKDPLPAGDLYCVARTLHDWPENKIIELLTKVHERLPNRGALLIAEKLLNDDRSGPYWAQMQNLNMLVLAEGKERTLGEYKELLGRVGFRQVKAAVTDGPLDFLLAVKSPPAKKKTGGSSIVESPRPILVEPLPPRPPRPAVLNDMVLINAFFHASNVGFVVATLQGDFLLVNEAFARLLGYETVEQVRRRNYRDVTPKDYEKEDEEQIQQLESAGFYGPFEKQYIRADRTLVAARVTLKLLTIEGHKLIWASVQEVGDQAGLLLTGGRVVEYRG